MYKIYFYRDKRGNRPTVDYIKGLASRQDKDSQIKARKIQEYLNALSKYGLQLKEPYIKHIDGGIWELRPLSDRFFFVGWTGSGFVILHHFEKKTRKTPPREIERAKRELADLNERGLNEDE